MDLRPADADRIADAFASDAFYVPAREVIAEEARRPLHGHFNLIHYETALKADCYAAGEDSTALTVPTAVGARPVAPGGSSE